MQWLPEGHLAYFVLDLVRELDVSPIDNAIQSKDGRGVRPYSPRMMTALLLYAYCVGVFSLAGASTLGAKCSPNPSSARSRRAAASAASRYAASPRPAPSGPSCASATTCSSCTAPCPGSRAPETAHSLYPPRALRRAKHDSPKATGGEDSSAKRWRGPVGPTRPITTEPVLTACPKGNALRAPSGEGPGVRFRSSGRALSKKYSSLAGPWVLCGRSI